MAYKMTKRGSLDNEVTNEFFCDTEEDLANIPPRDINLGTVAVVLEGLQIYIANSKKEWINFIGAAGDGSSTNSGASSNVVGEGAAGSMIIHDGEAAKPTADVGQADSMVLGE